MGKQRIPNLDACNFPSFGEVKFRQRDRHSLVIDVTTGVESTLYILTAVFTVPLMLFLVRFCQRTRGWFGPGA